MFSVNSKITWKIKSHAAISIQKPYTFNKIITTNVLYTPTLLYGGRYRTLMVKYVLRLASSKNLFPFKVTRSPDILPLIAQETIFIQTGGFTRLRPRRGRSYQIYQPQSKNICEIQSLHSSLFFLLFLVVSISNQTRSAANSLYVTEFVNTNRPSVFHQHIRQSFI